MSRWRGRIGQDKLELLLAQTLAAAGAKAVDKSRFERVTIDTTAQTKAVAHPTDSGLFLRAVEWLNRFAKRRSAASPVFRAARGPVPPRGCAPDPYPCPQAGAARGAPPAHLYRQALSRHRPQGRRAAGSPGRFPAGRRTDPAPARAKAGRQTQDLRAPCAGSVSGVLRPRPLAREPGVGPGQQIVDLAVRMAVDDPGEYVGEIAEWLDAIEFAGFDQRGDDGPVFGAGVRRDLMMPGFWAAR